MARGPLLFFCVQLLASPLAWSFEIIAHRGLSALAPESTEISYVLAAEAGADALEGDIQITRDGELILFHDTEMTRTTNVQEVFPLRASYQVKNFTLDELQHLDTGSWFNVRYPALAHPDFEKAPILELSRLLDIAEAYEKNLYLEIKPKEDPSLVLQKTLKILEMRGWINSEGRPLRKEKVVIQSFQIEVLEELQKLAPHISRLFLVNPQQFKQENGERIRAAADVISPFGIVVFLDWLNPARWIGLTQGYHRYLRDESEHSLEPWTINSPMGFFFIDKVLKAPAVFTDRTDLAFQYREQPLSPMSCLNILSRP